MKNTTNQSKLPENGNKNLTGYQLLHRKLDDQEFAREFTKRQTERAQELIAQILMVTSGVAEVTGEDREWGHANFLELFDIFQIRHPNFSLLDLSEELQRYVYTFSMAHGQAYREWKTGHYQERGLDEDGLEIEPANEAAQETAASEIVPEPSAHDRHLAIWANKIAHVLESDKVDPKIKGVISDIVIDAGNESGYGIDQPDVLKKAFPMFMKLLSDDYATGTLHAIQSIIDGECAGADGLAEELNQYEAQRPEVSK